MCMKIFEFIRMLSGDLLYLPRGIAHEAIATEDLSADGNRDLSLHLTIGLEAANSNSIEVCPYPRRTLEACCSQNRDF
jgi:hypothetical protein